MQVVKALGVIKIEDKRGSGEKALYERGGKARRGSLISALSRKERVILGAATSELRSSVSNTFEQRFFARNLGERANAESQQLIRTDLNPTAQEHPTSYFWRLHKLMLRGSECEAYAHYYAVWSSAQQLYQSKSSKVC